MDAAVVATTVITTGGVQGFFAQRKFRATVEVSDGSPDDAHAFDLPARAGIAALLDAADYRDTVDAVDEPWTASTSTVDFAAILADLTLNTASAFDSPAGSTPAPPNPARAPGDLMVVIGLGDDALAVATKLATGPGASVLRIAGDFDRAGIDRVDDRRAAIAARADGVRGGCGVVVAFGLPRGGATAATAGLLENLSADQCWVAVDAGRKPEDTARWVRAVTNAVTVTAAVSWSPEDTASPRTVSQLGLPLRWLESDW